MTNNPIINSSGAKAWDAVTEIAEATTTGHKLAQSRAATAPSTAQRRPEEPQGPNRRPIW